VSADVALNAIVLVTALAVVATARGTASDGLASRVRALFVALAALLAARLGLSIRPDAWVAVALMLAASWLPLMALLLVERIVRRHAPSWAKLAALGGATGFSLVALVVGAFWPLPVMVALAAFQALALAYLAAMLLAGRKDGLSPVEQGLAGSLALVFAMAVPLALADFRSVFPGLPIRPGALGITLLALAVTRFGIRMGAPWLVVADLALLVLGAGATVAAASTFLALASDDLVRLAAVAAAGTGLVMVAQRAGEVRLIARARPSLLAAIARLPADAGCDSLIAAHPLTAGAAVIEGESLDLYDRETLEALVRRGIVTRADAPGGDVQGAAANLLDAFAATHLVALSGSPPRFLAVAAPGLARDDPAGVELAIFARLVAGCPA
jgi:hypothetical protein